MRTFAPRIGGACERLHNRPVRQDIRGHVDFMPRGVDKINEVFKVLPRCIVNDRRGIGGAWCDKGEKENCGYGSARQVQTD